MRDGHAPMMVPASAEAMIREAWPVLSPKTLGAGTRMELYKGIGLPAAVRARLGHRSFTRVSLSRRRVIRRSQPAICLGG